MNDALNLLYKQGCHHSNLPLNNGFNTWLRRLLTNLRHLVQLRGSSIVVDRGDLRIATHFYDIIIYVRDIFN